MGQRLEKGPDLPREEPCLNDEVPNVVGMVVVVRCSGAMAGQSLVRERTGAGSAAGVSSRRFRRRDHTGVIPRSKAAG